MYPIPHKIALITGGTKGIGARIAQDLVDQGASVLITGRNDTPGVRAFVAHLNTKGKAVVHFGDIQGEAGAQAAVAAAVTAFGGLNILVHSAGGGVPGKITDINTETWMGAFDTHVHPVFHLFRAAHPHLKLQGGVMILISSVAGLRGCPNSVAYQAVKGALPQIARALAMDHAVENIRVNVIAPGVIRTDFHAAMTDAARAHNIANRIPMRREGTVEDVSSLALEMIRNDFITGECFAVDGGTSMRVTG